MKMKVYSVFDVKSAAYGMPWFAINDATAIRSWSQGVNREHLENAWFTNPEDFSLFCIGEYDDQFGLMVPMSLVPVITASNLLKPRKLAHQMELISNALISNGVEEAVS